MLCKRTGHLFCCNIAGWSSLEARRAHNPKVTGSNPVPATKKQLFRAAESRLLDYCFLMIKFSSIVGGKP